MLTSLQSLNHTANQKTAADQVARKQWIESHTPEQIHIANNARRLLKKKAKPSQKSLLRLSIIKDDRLPKRPILPRFFFAKEKFGSGDLKGLLLTDATKLITQEWDALSASEKKVCFHMIPMI